MIQRRLYLILLVLVLYWLLITLKVFLSTAENYTNVDAVIATPDTPTAQVTVIMACKNRNQHLRESITSWLQCPTISQIIVVDWSSDEPAIAATEQLRDPRVIMIRVQNESQWILSRAYNLAAQFVNSEFIFKVDVDVGINSCQLVQSIGRMFSEDKSYFTGDWRLARSENEKHLNGLLLVKTQHWREINGFDERITFYGWEDTNLHARLNSIGLQKKGIHPNMVYHIEHGNEKRAQDSTSIPLTVRIQYNRLMSEQLPSWSPKIVKSEYSIKEVTKSYFTAELIKPVLSYEEMFTEVELESTKIAINEH